MKKLLPSMLLILASMAMSVPLYSQSLKPRILGVVMGISKYQNVPSLKYADRDAMLFYNFLLSPAGGGADPNSIRLLLNEKATSYNFFEAMDNLLDMAKEGDQVYIYFAGHGDIEKKTERQNGFLIGYNAPANCYAAGGCISVRFLQDYVETLVSKNKTKVTLIIDACRSGKLAGGAEGAEVTALALKAEWKGVTKILSCQPGETSLEGEKWGGGAGVFSYFMLKGLLGQADENGDGKISAMELGSFLDKNVTKETNNKQLPELVGDRRQEIARVDKKSALGFLNLMERPMTLLPDKQSAGFEADISSIKDVSVLKEYVKFKEYIINNNLIDYADVASGTPSPNKKETALSIYRTLEGSRSAQPIITLMKRELLAALQNRAQINMNEYLNNIYTSRADSAYMELSAAYKICDSTDSQYEQIKFGYLLWRSFNKKDDQKKLELLKECTKINPNDPMLNICIGIYHFDKDNGNDALIYFSRVTELAKNWIWGWNNMGTVLDVLNRGEEAIQCLDKAIEIKPDFDVAWYNKGIAFDHLGKYEEAIKCNDQALKINPKFFLALISRGRILFHLGRKEEAEKCLNNVIELKINDDNELFELAKAFSLIGNSEQAINSYDKLIEKNPKNFNAWLSKGIELANNRKLNESLICFDKALEINKYSDRIYSIKGLLLIKLDKFDEAIKFLDSAIELNPNNSSALLNKGWSLYSLGKLEEAIIFYKKSLAIDPYSYGFNDLGMILSKLGRTDEELKCYDKAIELMPDNSMAWFNKGRRLSLIGKYEEAIKCLDKAIEIKPNDHMAWLQKAWVLDKLNRSEEALQFYDKTIQLNPKYFEAWANMGDIYHRLAKLDESIRYFQKAIEISPDDFQCWFSLAQNHALLKNKDEMLKSLKRAIELNPEFKEDAIKDNDLKEYWDDPDFKKLVE